MQKCEGATDLSSTSAHQTAVSCV
uniref:Uncharacterized protein n=1 Tax=Anguilla anguilla TaxID=7936 RepID=A0A0E9XN45_ANGAN